MRYGKTHPLARDFRLQPSAKILRGEAAWRPKEAGWKNWLLSNRTELETYWIQRV